MPDRLTRRLEHGQVGDRPDRAEHEAEAAEEMQRPVPVATHERHRQEVEEATHVSLHPVPRAAVLTRAVVHGQLRDAEAPVAPAPG